MFVGPDQPSVAVPVAGIDSLWVRGRATGFGARVGAFVGGVGLAAGAVVLSSVLDEYGNCTDCVLAGFGGAAVGAAGGALVGALIGSLCPKWHRRFP